MADLFDYRSIELSAARSPLASRMRPRSNTKLPPTIETVFELSTEEFSRGINGHICNLFLGDT
jgi:hypothetical protein